MLKEAAYGLGAPPGRWCGTWCCPIRASASSAGSCWGSAARWARPWRSPSSSATPTDHRLAPGARARRSRRHRQRVHRGGRRPLHLLADRARPDPVRHHLHHPAAAKLMLMRLERQAGSGLASMADDSALSPAPPAQRIAMALTIAAAAFGLVWLVLDPGDAALNGVSGCQLAVFTEMTPPPGSAGGLLNAIFGSLMHDHARRCSSARRSASWPAPIWPNTAARPARRRRPLHQRHPAERALDHRRPVRLRVMVVPMGISRPGPASWRSR